MERVFREILWPEHPDERLQTNLLYYRANYLVVTGGVVIVALLLQPAPLCAVLCAVLIVGAAAFTEPVLGLDATCAAAAAGGRLPGRCGW